MNIGMYEGIKPLTTYIKIIDNDKEYIKVYLIEESL
jgi:hypothetical protein